MRKGIWAVDYNVRVNSEKFTCEACRKVIKNEPYAVRFEYRRTRGVKLTTRCWRCWHTDHVTQLFVDKYPNLFRRDKQGRWYYLLLRMKWTHFPSSDGEHEPN